jgi:lycopene cyclase domain-containing protein
VPERFYYLFILLCCVLITLPLEFVLGARVYRRPLATVKAIAPVFVAFAAWDLIATDRGHWWFSERYTLGPRLFGLPLEEWLFFIVVPLCSLLTYDTVSRLLARRRAPAEPAERPAPVESGHRGP